MGKLGDPYADEMLAESASNYPSNWCLSVCVDDLMPHSMQWEWDRRRCPEMRCYSVVLCVWSRRSLWSLEDGTLRLVGVEIVDRSSGITDGDT